MVEDPVIELDDDTFEQVIKEGVVLVDYFAEWCAPCRSLAPILQEIAIELQDSMKFAKLNIDTSHKATKTSQITSVPTLILFQSGKEIGRLVGLEDYKAIKKFALSWKENK